VEVDIHRVATEGAQEEAGSPDRQGFAGAFQGQSIRQGLREILTLLSARA